MFTQILLYFFLLFFFFFAFLFAQCLIQVKRNLRSLASNQQSDLNQEVRNSQGIMFQKIMNC